MWELDHKEGWVLKKLMLLSCSAGEDSRVPWAAKRSNQLILKKINPEYSLEGLMLKLQHFGHLLWRADSLEKTLMLGKFEGRRRRGWQEIMVGWHHWLNGHEFEQTPGVWSEGQGSLMCCSTWGGQRDTTERLNNNNNNDNNKLSKLLRENGHRAHCWEY